LVIIYNYTNDARTHESQATTFVGVIFLHFPNHSRSITKNTKRVFHVFRSLLTLNLMILTITTFY